MLTLWLGICTGCVYVLVATGFNMVFVASGTFNFAQPQFLVLGTFLAYATVFTFGLSPWVALPFGLLAGAAIGAAEERLVIRPVRSKGINAELVTMVGWSVAMQGVMLLIWKENPLAVKGLAPDHVFTLLGVRVTAAQLVLVGVTLVLAVGLYLWSHLTMLGIASLATSEDRDVAMLRGINVPRLGIGAFALAGGLLCAMGPIAGPTTFAVYSFGDTVVLYAFLAMAIGGFGHNIGAIIGGLGLGIFQAEISLHWGDKWISVLTFALLLSVLLLRPQGLFGERNERVV
ncbi:branched-chain amino acid transport system permease protein [Rhodococcus sp. 27YEA15]|uniref:branched-chain amino acid ABC transporter permease n=1 Tax=Rhodococcus sp. 27YEA15 TaxID=3156259 RepID=UPI003C7A7B9D